MMNGEPAIDLKKYHTGLETVNPIRFSGRVVKVVGLVIEAMGPAVRVGHVCDVYPDEADTSKEKFRAEVIGFRDNRIILMPLVETRGIGPGSRVVAREPEARVGVGRGLMGRVIDGLGNPIDGKGSVYIEDRYPLYAEPINPIKRKPIRLPLDVGVRSINGLLTIGRGQRMGVFSGSGVGKSLLLGMIARKSDSDVNVIALIGERGRELNDFIRRNLGEDGMKRSVVVVATSDHPPLIRMRGAFTATTIAEYFRDQGAHVVLMMDSLTRFAMAQREVGLAAGEPPTTKGYTPSVFTLLPKLLERAGTADGDGTITGLYTVLVEGDDFNEPISDAVRGILDGHTVLSRELAVRNHYPAVDVLGSISRLMNDVIDAEHLQNANKIKEVLAVYRKVEDLINIGAYSPGANPEVDYAVSLIDSVNAYLKQGFDEDAALEDSVRRLKAILG